MTAIRFIMLGGFLGAGKTTAMARLARHFMDQGKRVGIVTNDQAQDLVDTLTLREQGFPVEEVAGACFCCKFDDLLTKVGTLESAQAPDVILAEPVGSCTDLVATVVQPLKDLYGKRFSVAPYAVLFKPSHGLKILRNDARSGFSPKAAYIFRKQLEEADAVLLNRIDELNSEQIDEMAQLVAAQFPGVPVLRVSAKTGLGFDAFHHLLDQQGAFGRKILDIDYDVYAEGEAELGWLNSSMRVTAAAAFDLDRLLLDVIAGLKQATRAVGAEAAHVKAIGLWEGFFGVANLVHSDGEPVLSLPSRCQVKETDLIINARVAMDPVPLQAIVEQVVRDVCTARGARTSDAKAQSFRPGRPTPTHRYAVATA
ncbi:MAG: cobalamin biosynthesis protein P47K [Planctomycetes bacterium]|nr:cobalamin biosynthesis protein P47K [Planctomycetota bacterium]